MGLLTLRDRSSLSMETIDYQNDDFPAQLTKLHDDLITKIINSTYYSSKDIQTSDEVKAIETLTFKRLGLRVRIITNGPLAAVQPFYINKFHSFIPKQWHGKFSIPGQDQQIEKMLNQKGTIDLKRAKVSGIFSEAIVEVYMNYKELAERFSINAEETTAFYLHECGHAFGVYEFSDRLSTCNRILSDAAKRLSEDKNDKTLEYVYRDLSKVNPKISRGDITKMIDGDRTIAGSQWMKCYVDSVTHQLHNSKYDNTNNEQMADSFAVRFNMGRAMISGLHKIGGENSELMNHPGTQAYGMIVLSTFFGFYFGVLLLALGLGAAGLFTFVGAFITSRVYFNSEAGRDYVYDDPKMRYQRIRNQYVDRLKDSRLSGDEIKSTIETVEFVDKVIEQTASSESIYRSIGNIIFRSSAQAKKSIEEQQIMEKLVSNDLYIHSAKLKTA